MLQRRSSHHAAPMHLRLTLAVALAVVSRSAAAQRSPTGHFELAPPYAGETRVHLTLSESDDWRSGTSSFSLPAAALPGLDIGRLSSDGEQLRFRLVRDAGTIEFTGRVADRHVIGRYA